MAPCLDDDELLGLQQGTLPAERAAAARLHLIACPSCMTVVNALLDREGPRAVGSAPRAPDPGRSSAPCPDGNTLNALADGRLAPQEAATLHEHLSTCSLCIDVLAALSSTRSQALTPAPVEFA